MSSLYSDRLPHSLLLARVFRGITQQKCHKLHMLLCLLLSGALYVMELHASSKFFKRGMSSHCSTLPCLEVAVL